MFSLYEIYERALNEMSEENECDCCQYFHMESVYQYGGMEKPLYYMFSKGYKYDLKYMDPKTYINLIAKNFGISPEQLIHESDYEKANEYAQSMRSGGKFPVGFLLVGSDEQEGRHRALAAMSLGCDKIPVVKIRRIDEQELKEMAMTYSKMSYEQLDEKYKKEGYEQGISPVGYKDMMNFAQNLSNE